MNPELITWARKRAGIAVDTLVKNRDFKHLREWENGKMTPTHRQLFQFAKAVYIPDGYLYLPEPPDESLKSIEIEDFRTVGGQAARRLSPYLIDMIYACQRRQGWYHEYAVQEGIDPVSFVGTAQLNSSNHKHIAEAMAESLRFGLGEQGKFRSVGRALREFRAAAESAGVLVMSSKHARKNTRIKLDVSEFRGFALSDRLAPLIFLNGADYVPAQMFTLAHELAHLWLGDTGISSADAVDAGRRSKKEAWCNRVAAEFLVPIGKLDDIDTSSKHFRASVEQKAKRLHVSRHVILRRLVDGKRIDNKAYRGFVSAIADQPEGSRRVKRSRRNKVPVAVAQPRKNKASSGNITAARIISRMGRIFPEALVRRKLEDNALPTEVYRFLGTYNPIAIQRIAEKLDVV